MANEHQHFIFLLNLLNGIGVRRFVWPWPRHATTNISMPLPPDNLIHARMTDCICLPESIIEIMWICVSHFANKYKTIQLKCFASARPKESSRKRKPKKNENCNNEQKNRLRLFDRRFNGQTLHNICIKPSHLSVRLSILRSTQFNHATYVCSFSSVSSNELFNENFISIRYITHSFNV